VFHRPTRVGDKSTLIFLIPTLFCPQVFDDSRIQGSLLEKVVAAFLRLAYNACQVPNRYKIDRSLGFNVDPTVFASGRFSDVRKGKLGGQLVAVKTLRMFLDSKMSEGQKVRHPRLCFFFVLH